MKIVYFTHSLSSDWNHGNAHFLRGLLRALRKRGHDAVAAERRRNWSADNLYADRGAWPFVRFGRIYPDLAVRTYGGGSCLREEVDRLTADADVVIVHEFSEPELVSAVAAARRDRNGFVALFHDTHHRAVTEPCEIRRFELAGFDGVLAYGDALAEVYRTEYAVPRVWTFHEAADTTVFRPMEAEKADDVVWIGNWGDEERTREIREYLVDSARCLEDLRFAVHGVRYPEGAVRELGSAGIDFRGWIANYDVPEAFARAKLTLHIPRGPYREMLPGIPTIRPFEAMACGIPMLCAPWEDTEGLFRPGRDYIPVASPGEMRDGIRRLSRDADARARIGESGVERIRARHTCDHRAEELEAVVAELTRV